MLRKPWTQILLRILQLVLDTLEGNLHPSTYIPSLLFILEKTVTLLVPLSIPPLTCLFWIHLGDFFVQQEAK